MIVEVKACHVSNDATNTIPSVANILTAVATTRGGICAFVGSVVIGRLKERTTTGKMKRNNLLLSRFGFVITEFSGVIPDLSNLLSLIQSNYTGFDLLAAIGDR